MKLSILSREDGLAHVAVTGKITQEQAALASDPLRELLGPDVYAGKVILHMQDADFVDSSGVSWLLIAHKRFKENKGRIVLHSIQPVVMNVLKVLRMHLVFDLADNEQVARKTIQGDAK